MQFRTNVPYVMGAWGEATLKSDGDPLRIAAEFPFMAAMG